MARRTKAKTSSKDKQNGKPHDLDSVLASVRALWESTDDADQDIREDLRNRIIDDVSRLNEACLALPVTNAYCETFQS